ncbi:Transglutaminase elicitor [Phytophthora megakarya]|uniref:Transglutaminase elicitor n=1 Tax=Phytophthora megakarya TaxID=4795 RepID=A0A225VYV0_9STRA|nr:Transglutaminase elicitor [Phytophthora megakarya]
MVFKRCTSLVSAAVTVMALQMQHASASSLQYDPYTSCTSYDISDENFPGRGTEITDDGKCTVTVPEDPKLIMATTISTTAATHMELLSNESASPVVPVFTKVGTEIMSEPMNTNPDAYIVDQTSTPGIPPSTTNVFSRRLEESTTRYDIDNLEEFFGTKMELKLKKLPTSGVYNPTPWAGSNWPAYLDSINYEWNTGEPSPAEKYAQAFRLDVKDFMNNECFDPVIDTVCAKRTGQTSGYCIPTWFGLCHAWAPAAILEKEPNCPVTYNGVTFNPMDIKALLTDVYSDSNMSTLITGVRYNGAEDEINDYGSHTEYSYRDLNPGYFHIAAANILGTLNSTFIIDRDAGYEVWNQPVIGFKVYEQTNMTTEETAQTFFGLESYPWNDNATSIVYVKSRLSWANETFTDGGLVASGLNQNFTVGAFYDYLLELDEEENIIGGEWLYDSNNNHPDFLWLPMNKPTEDVVTSIGLRYSDVAMLLAKAVACFDLEKKT